MKLKKWLFLVCIVFFSCVNKDEGKGKVIGEVKEVNLDYVFEKAEFCRGSQIIFEGYFYNYSDTIVRINSSGLDSFCNFYREGDFTMKFPTDSLVRNGISMENLGGSINPNDSLFFRFRLQVKHLYEYDSLYYNVKHLLPQSAENIAKFGLNAEDSINLRIDHSTAYRYYLDDTEYEDFDEMVSIYITLRTEQYKNLTNRFSDSLTIK